MLIAKRMIPIGSVLTAPLAIATVAANILVVPLLENVNAPYQYLLIIGMLLGTGFIFHYWLRDTQALLKEALNKQPQSAVTNSN